MLRRFKRLRIAALAIRHCSPAPRPDCNMCCDLRLAFSRRWLHSSGMHTDATKHSAWFWAGCEFRCVVSAQRHPRHKRWRCCGRALRRLDALCTSCQPCRSHFCCNAAPPSLLLSDRTLVHYT